MLKYAIKVIKIVIIIIMIKGRVTEKIVVIKIYSRRRKEISTSLLE